MSPKSEGRLSDGFFRIPGDKVEEDGTNDASEECIEVVGEDEEKGLGDWEEIADFDDVTAIGRTVSGGGDMSAEGENELVSCVSEFQEVARLLSEGLATFSVVGLSDGSPSIAKIPLT